MGRLRRASASRPSHLAFQEFDRLIAQLLKIRLIASKWPLGLWTVAGVNKAGRVTHFGTCHFVGIKCLRDDLGGRLHRSGHEVSYIIT